MTLQKVVLPGLLALASATGLFAKAPTRADVEGALANLPTLQHAAPRGSIPDLGAPESAPVEGAPTDAAAPAVESNRDAKAAFGQWVSAQTHAGVHGRELADAIHAEKGKGGKGRGDEARGEHGKGGAARGEHGKGAERAEGRDEDDGAREDDEDREESGSGRARGGAHR